MRNLFRQIVQRETRQLSVRETILWWEWRRAPYNLLVCVAGIVSITSGVLTALLTKSECGILDPPLFAVIGVILYGIAANVLYTGGWLAELLVRRYTNPRKFAVGTFIVGLAFSVLLTLSPAFFIPVACTLGGGSAIPHNE